MEAATMEGRDWADRHESWVWVLESSIKENRIAVCKGILWCENMSLFDTDIGILKWLVLILLVLFLPIR